MKKLKIDNNKTDFINKLERARKTIEHTGEILNYLQQEQAGPQTVRDIGLQLIVESCDKDFKRTARVLKDMVRVLEGKMKLKKINPEECIRSKKKCLDCGKNLKETNLYRLTVGTVRSYSVLICERDLKILRTEIDEVLGR